MIKIYLESATRDSKYSELLSVLKRLENFKLVDAPGDAEAILFPDDDFASIRRSPAFQNFKSKCLAINDGDILSYYIPALYASNFRCMLSRDRALTISPYCYLFEDAPGKRNALLSKLKDVNFEKRFLYSFMGGSTCWLRKRLLKQYKDCALDDVLVQGTDHYKHWIADDRTAGSEQQRRYVETMLSSKFVVCPRGASASSIRLFEAMELGCAPVVLADDWIPVDGVDWSFCLFVKESELANLDSIIRSHSGEWKERGLAARRTFEEHFSRVKFGATLERQIRQLIQSRSESRERLVHMIHPIRRAVTQTKAAARLQLRNLVLFGFKLLGKKFPYELNR